jgi:undecaprenyl diphosphate synthase
MSDRGRNDKDDGNVAGHELTAIPRHVAIIMDGNGRWAQSRNLGRVQGHRSGAESIKMVVEEARRLGVRYLTLFAFSTENWHRPEDEVSSLMKLFKYYLDSELERLLKNDIRLRAIGQIERLPSFVREPLERNQERTAELTGMDLVLALSYGGRSEIVSATRKIAERIKAGELNPADIDEAYFAGNLYAPDIPDPDLLIRTSGENRISNFLLWQLAYSEIIMTPVLWPDFSRDEFYRCISEFGRRNRRFGLTEEQANGFAAKGV